MDSEEAKTRIRSLFTSLQSATEGEREAKVRQEIKAIVEATPKAEQAAVLDGLCAVFPIWPPDVPPPAAPTDEELVDLLRARASRSPGDNDRIEFLLRSRELGSGLGQEDIVRLRRALSLEGAADPRVGRVVEALAEFSKVLLEVDRLARDFLKQRGLGMMGLNVPRLKESLNRFLVMADQNVARYGELAKLQAACDLTNQVLAMLVQSPDGFAERVAEIFAPAKIEAAVGSGMFWQSKAWAEFAKRANKKTDEQGFKAELLTLYTEVIRSVLDAVQRNA